MTEPLPAPLDALHAALHDEARAEADAIQALDDAPLEDRVAVGLSWPRLTVDEVEPAGRRWRVSARAAKGVALHDGIGPGDPVTLRFGGRATAGWVDDVDPRRAELVVDDAPPPGAPVEVQRRADPSTWLRYRRALERGARHRSPLVMALLGQGPPTAHREGAALQGLDPAQRDAADAALRADAIAAIHGPPGTGKTHVIGALLVELVRRGDRPFALADSNAAVDHLTASACQRGLRVLRLGPTARADPSVHAATVAEGLRRSPFAPALDALARDLARASGPSRRALLDEQRQLRDRAFAHLVDGAEVITSTFGTLARLADRLPDADTAVVDEATQATEPAIWVVVPKVKRLILVGDPQQLGPVSRVPGSPLGRSLLDRLLAEARVAAPMLGVQHRMDAHIRELVAEVYGPDYRDHPSVAHQPLVSLAGVRRTPLTEATVRWIDTAGAGADEEVDPVSRSLRNPVEAAIVARLVQALLRAGVPATAIAVITPYSAQVAALRAMLPGVDVATVNAFQGRERDVIVASWVRSNTDGDVGFVADPRRLTVTLTRARRALWLVGDTATLASAPRFGDLADRLAAQDALTSVFEDPWIDALSG